MFTHVQKDYLEVMETKFGTGLWARVGSHDREVKVWCLPVVE